MLRQVMMLAVVLGAMPAAHAQGVSVGIGVGGGVGVTFETFQGPLAAHGEWLHVGAYGTVWRPHRVAAGWRPYFYGQWQWTDQGWYWDSQEPWGWATYHYGRWAWEPAYGWVWVPGYQWAPAWVDWRYDDDAIGWAPLFPSGVVIQPRYEHWVFMPSRSFVGFHVHTHAYSPSWVRSRWHSHYRHRPRHHVYSAPPRHYVERRVGRPIRPHAVHSRPSVHRRHEGSVVHRPSHPRPPPQVRRAEPPRRQHEARPAAPRRIENRRNHAPPTVVRSQPTRAPERRPAYGGQNGGRRGGGAEGARHGAPNRGGRHGR